MHGFLVVLHGGALRLVPEDQNYSGVFLSTPLDVLKLPCKLLDSEWRIHLVWSEKRQQAQHWERVMISLALDLEEGCGANSS